MQNQCAELVDEIDEKGRGTEKKKVRGESTADPAGFDFYG